MNDNLNFTSVPWTSPTNNPYTIGIGFNPIMKDFQIVITIGNCGKTEAEALKLCDAMAPYIQEFLGGHTQKKTLPGLPQ